MFSCYFPSYPVPALIHAQLLRTAPFPIAMIKTDGNINLTNVMYQEYPGFYSRGIKVLFFHKVSLTFQEPGSEPGPASLPRCSQEDGRKTWEARQYGCVKVSTKLVDFPDLLYLSWKIFLTRNLSHARKKSHKYRWASSSKLFLVISIMSP